MNKNIVLVYPKPYENLGLPQLGMTSLPMSLLYLASASRKICDDIVIFDFNINDNDLNNFEKVLLKNLPQVVGINCMFSMNFKQVLSLSVFVKNKIPESRVVIGGIHPTIFAEQIMQNCSSIDAIVLGEGDAAFPRLLEYYFPPPPPNQRESVLMTWKASFLGLMGKLNVYPGNHISKTLTLSRCRDMSILN